MANQVKMTTTPSAWVVNSKDRGRKSVKKGKVYLQDKEEFIIELFNPLQDCVLADIKLNGKSISETGLVLNPGQRFYLDCFIDDKKKFIFNTYEVEDTTEVTNAIAKNGLLEVFFYKESVVKLENWSNKLSKIVIEKHYPAYYPAYYPWGTTNPYIVYGNGITYGNSFHTGNLVGTTTVNTGNVYCSTGTVDLTNIKSTGTVDLTNIKSTNNAYYSSNCIQINNSTQTSFSSNVKSLSIETGRVEKGQKSRQKFESIDMEFDKYYIASTILQILPESRKPVETKEIGKERRIQLDQDNYKNKSEDVIELIKKLAELHKVGILTDEEFTIKKVELLSKI
jgi:hypothetical protein